MLRRLAYLLKRKRFNSDLDDEIRFHLDMAAQERGERGVVRLQFRIDRDGRVMSSQVVKSSGYPVLDQETIETVHRAQPFPPPPADLKGQTFDFSVPVSFNIR